MKPKHTLIAGFSLLSMMSQSAYAAGTEAGVEIRLQSTATYVDGIGQSQSVSSNEVVVVIQEVYGLTVSAVPATLNVAPGNSAEYAYLITNNGNIAESFSLTFADSAGSTDADSIQAYFDANLNGQVDPGDIEITSGGTTPLINADQSGGIIIQINTATATATVGASDIDVDLTIASAEEPSVNAVRDNMSVSFIDGVGLVDYNLTANSDTVAPATAVEFTLSGSNTGESDVFGSTGVILDGNSISEAVLIPIDLSSAVNDFNFDTSGGATNYTGITTNSIAPATGTVVYWDGTDWDDNPGTVISGGDARVALLLQPTTLGDAILAIGQEFELRFSLTSNASVSTSSIEFSGIAEYGTTAGGAVVTANSNTIALRVVQDAGTTTTASLVTIEPFFNGTFTSAVTHPVVIANPTGTLLLGDTTDDETETGARSAGEEILIPLTVNNPSGGAGIDTYDITASTVAGITVELLNGDGVTPLQDTDSDSVRDTGDVTVGGSVTIIARLIIDETVNTPGSQVITLTARAQDGTTETTDIIISEIYPAGVDIAFNGEAGDQVNAGDNDVDPTDSDSDGDATTLNVAAGGIVQIPLDIRNLRIEGATQLETGDFDSYALTYSAPTGLIVRFYNDTDGDGVLDNDELQQILNTTPLNPFTVQATNTFDLIAVVEATTSAIGGSVTLTATSLNNSAISDAITFGVTVPAAASLDIEPEVFATVVPGGNVIISHTITNRGNAAATNVAVTLTGFLPSGYSAIWTDATGSNLGTGTTNEDPGTLTVANVPSNGEATIFLRIGVPSNVPAGETLAITVNAAGAGSVIDILQVVAGNLELVKEQSVAGATLTDALVNTASPGNTVTYQTTFTNRGSADLDSVIIFETVPEHTALSVATVTVTGGFGVAATPVAVTDFTVEYSINGGNSWSTVVPATLSDTTNVRVLLTNALQPAESGTVSFTVTIQ